MAFAPRGRRLSRRIPRRKHGVGERHVPAVDVATRAKTSRRVVSWRRFLLT
jgi:hypothetical protein